MLTINYLKFANSSRGSIQNKGGPKMTKKFYTFDQNKLGIAHPLPTPLKYSGNNENQKSIS